VRERLQVGPKEAAEYVRSEDVARGRYVRKYYGVDIEDPLLYDALINTDRVSYRDAARLIADAVTVVGVPVEEPTPGPREAVRT
jgi:cytidylate kinase